PLVRHRTSGLCRVRRVSALLTAKRAAVLDAALSAVVGPACPPGAPQVPERDAQDEVVQHDAKVAPIERGRAERLPAVVQRAKNCSAR
ncbi:hypothetical protein, partial [Saccharopolyspora hordei]|uniref:hypothetical protein n=1 Tax=Saccharopolyspora hordei TaxID=1838 RepID=UPI0031E89D71